MSLTARRRSELGWVVYIEALKDRTDDKSEEPEIRSARLDGSKAWSS